MALTQIKSEGIKDSEVKNADMADDAVGVAELSASGTAGNTTFLRGDNSWATPPAGETNRMPLAGGTFTGDVIFDNATNAGKDLTWDMSDDSLEFADNTKAVFGDGGDLKIYHNGTDNYIMPSNGKLIINNGSETLAQFISDGTVELFYDGVLKFKTVSGGVRTAGNLELLDDHILQLGSGTDFQIHHKSADNGNYIECENGRTLYYQSDLHAILDEAGNEYIIKGTANGAVELYYNNSKKLETQSDGVTVSGWVYIPDSDGSNNMLRLGNGADLQIYHDGSNSYIDETATGSLILRASPSIEFRKAGGTEKMLYAEPDAQVELYYDDTKRFETVSDGIRWTGHCYANDNYKLRLGTGEDLQIYHDGTQSVIETNSSATKPLHLKGDPIWFYKAGTSELFCKMVADSSVELYHNDVNTFQTAAHGATIHNVADARLVIQGSGHPSVDLSTTGTTDNCSVNFGDSDDGDAGEILYAHTGNTMRFYTGGTERMRLSSDGLHLGGTGSSNAMDDYEAGDWTPTFEGSSTSGSFSYDSGYGTGAYVKIGNLVTCTIYTGNMTISGTAGVARVANLPFTSRGGNRLHNAFVVTHATCFDHACSGGYVNPGESHGYFMQTGNTTTSNSWNGGGYLMFTVSYQTA